MADTEPSVYDRVMKDIFFHDHPGFLRRLLRGKRVREIVNSELPKTVERRADMVLLVDPREVHHLEFQSHNLATLPYRQGVDCFLLAERYRKRRVVQTVIYFGDAPLRMPDRLDTGAGRVRYRLIDIRQFDAMDVAAGGEPADLVLATLAHGGRAHLRELLARMIALPPELRNRALAQVALLAGLRRMAGIVKMEMHRMGLAAEFAKNEILREYFEEAENKGLAKGLVEGRVEGSTESLRVVLETKFGALPPWAAAKIDKATPVEILQWLKRSVSARSLDAVLKS